jgi:hypothetical protein
MGLVGFAIFMIAMILILRVGQSTVGVDLQYNTATSGPAVWDSWGCIHDISGPEITATTSDASCLNSEDGWKEFVAGMKDGGEVTFTMVTQYGENVQDSPGSVGVCQNWRIVVPMTDCAGANPDMVWYITFDGWVTRFGPRFEYDGVQMQDWTIKVTGPVEASEPVNVEA